MTMNIKPRIFANRDRFLDFIESISSGDLGAYLDTAERCPLFCHKGKPVWLVRYSNHGEFMTISYRGESISETYYILL